MNCGEENNEVVLNDGKECPSNLTEEEKKIISYLFADIDYKIRLSKIRNLYPSGLQLKNQRQ